MVINIINFDLVVLTLLKVILDIERFDPGRTQVVHDHLSDSESVPLLSLLAIEYNHTIGTGECIQVGQIFTCEGECDCVHQTTLVGVDTLIDGSKDSVIEITTCSSDSTGLN